MTKQEQGRKFLEDNQEKIMNLIEKDLETVPHEIIQNKMKEFNSYIEKVQIFYALYLSLCSINPSKAISFIAEYMNKNDIDLMDL